MDDHKIIEPEEMAVKPGAPQHPGPWIRNNVLRPFKLSVVTAAEKIGVNRVTLTRVVNGERPLSRDLAYRLEALTGVDAALMIAMQTAFDLAQESEQRAEYGRTIERLDYVAAG